MHFQSGHAIVLEPGCKDFAPTMGAAAAAAGQGAPVSRPSCTMFLHVSASRHLPLEQIRLRQSLQAQVTHASRHMAPPAVATRWGKTQSQFLPDYSGLCPGQGHPSAAHNLRSCCFSTLERSTPCDCALYLPSTCSQGLLCAVTSLQSWSLPCFVCHACSCRSTKRLQRLPVHTASGQHIVSDDRLQNNVNRLTKPLSSG
jgi:hypothetical protein